MTKGYGANEGNIAYLRARQLCEGSGEDRELAPILWNLTQLHIQRAELDQARQLSEVTLDLAERLQNSTLLVGAFYNCAELAYRQGKPKQVRFLVDKVSDIYEHGHSAEALNLYGFDVCVANWRF